MPLLPDFTVNQDVSNPALVNLTDTSTGSDTDITGRRVTIQLANGNFIVQAGNTLTFEAWALANNSISLNLLTRSITPTITVQWMNGSTVLYTKSKLAYFTLMDYLFALQMINAQAINPHIVSNPEYYNNFIAYISNIWNAENSIVMVLDQYGSQAALDRNYSFSKNYSF